jgi:putative toxin-antitoxin system antitoxin component (TIGR02293 family)
MSEVAPPQIAALLGLQRPQDKPLSALNLVDRIAAGLPVGALHKVAAGFAPHDKSFVFRLVPRATLARRQRSHRLSPEEGERLARFARVWRVAIDVWQDEDAARAFLERPHPLLEGRKPIDLVLANEPGAKLTEDILGRLKYGTAA